MIRYRNVYSWGNGPGWRSLFHAEVGRMGGEENLIRIEMLVNGIPFRPPVGLTKREPTFLIRSTESGQWYAGFMQGLTDIHNAYEYTSAEILDKHTGWLWGGEIIRTDEAFERYAGGL